MNLVAVLIAPAVVAMSPLSTTPSSMRFLIAGVAVAVIVIAVVISSRRAIAIADTPQSQDPPATRPAIAVEETLEGSDPQAQPEVKVERRS